MGRKARDKVAQGRVRIVHLPQQSEHSRGGVLLLASGRMIHPDSPNPYPLDMPLSYETGKRGGNRAVREPPAEFLLDGPGAHRRTSGPQNREDRSFQLAGLAADNPAGVRRLIDVVVRLC